MNLGWKGPGKIRAKNDSLLPQCNTFSMTQIGSLTLYSENPICQESIFKF